MNTIKLGVVTFSFMILSAVSVTSYAVSQCECVSAQAANCQCGDDCACPETKACSCVEESGSCDCSANTQSCACTQKADICPCAN